MKDYPSPTANILKVLEFAFEDEDWEVRLSAMLATCRYQLTDFKTLVKKCDLPSSTSSGLSKPLIRSLGTIKKVVLSYLENQRIPDNPGKDLSSKKAFASYCLRIILDQNVSIANDYFLLIKSLIQPVAPKLPLEKIPTCIHTDMGDLMLKGTNIEMLFIPNYSHWIGSDTEEGNPIKLVKPKKGFFISRDPIRPRDGDRYSNDFLLKSFDGALRHLEALRGLIDYDVKMPNNLAIEMAIRGHNGRLYPWGNSLNHNEILMSPWGINQPLGTLEYWSSSTFDDELAYTFGGPDHRYCSQRTLKNRKEKCTMRILID